jgi:tRNA modification GTPase
MVEIHTLGSPPLLELVLASICAGGARLAEPGEFTLRAFLAGRLDLTQAEAVLGVIDAADGVEFNLALRQLAGGITIPMTKLREDLIDLLAELEAGLDFVEEDIEFISSAELEARLAAAATSIAGMTQQMALRTQSRECPRVVLVGWPNVGKSSLFNALAGGDRALVSTTPGTTRDYLTADLDLDGIRVQLVDTAGIEDHGMLNDECGAQNQQVEPNSRQSALRSTHPALPDIGMAAQQASAHQRAQGQVRLLCLDSTRACNDWERQQLANSGDLIVLTKCDRADAAALAYPGMLPTSAHTGQGLGELREQIRRAVENPPRSGAGVVASTATRCHESLRLAAESLARATDLACAQAGEELIAVETRTALNELGKVVGAVYTDDILDRIFSRFCIGK